MALKPPKPVRMPLEAGTHLAVCYMIAEIGTHETDYKGQSKTAYQVVLGFEFPDLRTEGEKDGKKFSYPKRKSNTYTFSYHEKSKLGQILQSWCGQKPTQDFDLFEMLGKNAMVNIAHETSGNGNTYDKITTVTQLPARIQPVKPESRMIRFSFQENGKTLPEHLPDWIVAKIKAAKEWEYMEDAEHRLVTGEAPICPPEDVDNGAPEDTPDDVPF